MYCPDCGSEEREATPFCRKCGRDMRPVRTAVVSTDVPAGLSAREEIGRAFAAKIRDMRDADEMSTFAEDVLPEIEKFLESPQEKRMRRMRTGIILSSVGLGVAIGMFLATVLMQDEDFTFLAGLGLVAFFLGLGFVLNGMLLTVPKKSPETGDTEARNILKAADTEVLTMPATSNPVMFPSATESTTRHLDEKMPGE